MKKQTTVLLLTALMGFGAEAKTIRAIDMKSSDWAELKKNGQEEILIEFRQGETVPVTINAGGDLVEVRRPTVTEVSVKRDFWVRILNDNFQFSLDGHNFKPMSDSLRGNLSLGADDTGNFTVGINAFLK